MWQLHEQLSLDPVYTPVRETVQTSLQTLHSNDVVPQIITPNTADSLHEIDKHFLTPLPSTCVPQCKLNGKTIHYGSRRRALSAEFQLLAQGLAPQTALGIFLSHLGFNN